MVELRVVRQEAFDRNEVGLLDVEVGGVEASDDGIVGVEGLDGLDRADEDAECCVEKLGAMGGHPRRSEGKSSSVTDDVVGSVAHEPVEVGEREAGVDDVNRPVLVVAPDDEAYHRALEQRPLAVCERTASEARLNIGDH